jgi:hypothetical protein
MNPMDLLTRIQYNIQAERKEPEKVFITRKNRLLVGLNVLSNRLTDISRRMNLTGLTKTYQS